MINYFRNSEIDKDKWDACIESCNIHKPYAYSWYLDIMAPGWEAMVDDDYDSVFPIPGFRKYAISYITTPVFLQQLGAFSPDKPGREMLSDFLDYLPQFYRLIDLSVAQKTESQGFKVTERSNFELDVSKPFEKTLAGYSSDCRRNIQLASKKEPVLTKSIEPAEIIDLFLRNKGAEIIGVKPRDYERLERLMLYCLVSGHGEMVGVRNRQKKLIHGIFVVSVNGSKTLLFTAGCQESREKRTGYFVVNELIKMYSGTRCIIDFAGSSIPSVASFMESFGSKNRPYYRMYKNNLPVPLRWLK